MTKQVHKQRIEESGVKVAAGIAEAPRISIGEVRDMTTIKASCPVCGDVELTPEQLRLIVCNRVEWSYYSFQCPNCSDEVRKPADDEIVSLLQSGGVEATPWHIPAEAMEEHYGATISYDEVLDFALWLDRHDYVPASLASSSTN